MAGPKGGLGANHVQRGAKVLGELDHNPLHGTHSRLALWICKPKNHPTLE
jgi:hypothetical protein